LRTVLFCGGLGLRLREHTERVPKPMVPIGYRPVLWHVMKYYAHFGHKDFVLCLGYKADVVKQYFLDYNEALSNDFVLNGNGHDRRGDHLELLSSDIHDWRITFADTGLHANVGQRLKAAQRYLDGEDVFLANYGDVLTDAPLPELIDDFLRQDKVAAFISVRPTYTFHVVSAREDGVVERIDDVRVSDIWINGGYMILRKGDLRLHRRRGGAGPGAVPAPHQAGPAARLPLRGVLGADGHPQGPAGPRGPVRGGEPGLGALAAVTPCSA
jgi:glucose-1-phosphate cytidylyltransferase